MSSGAHILLVEDNEATRYVVSRILVNAGYRVTTAESGEKALALVGDMAPDLVLLDVKLPGVSGFDVARQLRTRHETAAIPVVHLSASSISTAEQVRGLEGGADAYLTHPIEPRVLVATLEALLRARRAEARYRKLFDTGLLGIVTWDDAGVIVDANEAFLALVGLPREEVTSGRARFGALFAEDLGTPHEQKAALPAGGSPRELTVVRADGARVPVLVGRARNGDRDHAVAFLLDISERKRMEDALREADRRKDEFLAVLSHELRNPLAPIRNAIAILARAPADGPQGTRARQILERQSAHLTHLVDDLLDVTRVARGKIQLRRSTADVGEIVRKAAEDARSTFDHAGVHLGVEVSPAPIWVDVDPTRISQVILNLLQNAAKFTPSGGHVQVAVRAEGERAEVQVQDDGIGMAAEEMAHLFEPFSQADRSLARSRGGLGLGLALVRGLLTLHGGSISAHSEGKGRGSRFTVTLPLAPATTQGEAPPHGASSRPFTVVIIEDHTDARQSLADLLRLHGHLVQVAHDGASGIAMAVAHHPDVVICDIGLPDLDGYQVARALRADARLAGMHLIALSGYASPDDRERAAAAGFDGHLAKPPTVEALEQLFAGLRQGARG